MTEAEQLAWLRERVPPGYEVHAPSAPGGPWSWTAPGGDCGAEWSPAELLDEIRHHAAAQRARDE